MANEEMEEVWVDGYSEPVWVPKNLPMDEKSKALRRVKFALEGHQEGMVESGKRVAADIGRQAVGMLDAFGRNQLTSIGVTPPDVNIEPEFLQKIPHPQGGEKFASAAGFGALTGGLSAGARGLAQATIGSGMGAAGGIGSQAGLEYAKNEKMGPLGQTGMALIGGLATTTPLGIGRSFLPNRGGMSKEVLRGLEPDELAAGAAAQAEGGITAAQAMRRRSGLDSMQEVLANSKHGAKTTKMLETQPENLLHGVQTELGTLPGTVLPPQALANRGQLAANAELQAIKNQMGDKWRSIAGDESMSTRDIRKFDKKLEALEKGKQTTPDDAALYAEVRENLRDTAAPAAPGVTNWRTDPIYLKDMVDQTFEKWSNNTQNQFGQAAKSAGQSKKIHGLLDEVLEGSKFKQANLAYKRMNEELLEPLKQSVVGRVAGKRGEVTDANAQQRLMLNILDEGNPLFIRKEADQILKLEKHLRPQDPQLFPDLVKTRFTEKFAQIAKEDSSRTPESVAKRTTSIFGDPNNPNSKAWADTVSQLKGVARSYDVPENQLVDAFKVIAISAARQANRPRDMGSALGSGMASPTAGTPINRLGNFSMINALRQPAVTVAQLTDSSILKAFDNAMSSKDGILRMMEWRKAAPDNRLLATWAESMGGVGAVAGQAQQPMDQ